MTILLVEDTEDLGRLVLFTLRDIGHEVLWARDGASFHALLDASPPDLVILDIGLPDASGLDLLRLLKTRPQGERVRVLMLTANSQLDVMSEALDSGADRYLVKPFAPKVLRRRVTQLLEEAPRP